MARTLMLLANETDYGALVAACSSFGLHLIPMQPGSDIGSPAKHPVCFLSYLPQSELHPTNGTQPRFVEVIDPLLLFARPYQEAHFLVDGQIRLNEDNRVVARKIKPYFAKIERWLKRNWQHHKSIGAYIGPGGQHLLASSQAAIKSSLSGVPVEYVPVLRS